MFNGGTRKRVFTSSSSSSSSSSASSLNTSSMSSSGHSSGSFSGRPHGHTEGGSGGKKAKTAPTMESNPYLPKPQHFPNPFNPYNWLTAAPGKTPYPFMTLNSSQSMCFGFPPQPAPNKDAMVERMKAPPMAPASWMGRSATAAGPFSLSSMDLFWDKAFGFPQAAALGFRNGGYPSSSLTGATGSHAAMSAAIIDNPGHISPPSEAANCLSPSHCVPQNLMKSNFDNGEKMRSRMSAFKRVVPCSTSPPSSVSSTPNNHDDKDTRVNNDYSRDDDDDDEDDDDGMQ